VRDVCFDDNRSNSRCDGGGGEGHSSQESSIGQLTANGIEQRHIQKGNAVSFDQNGATVAVTDQPKSTTSLYSASKRKLGLVRVIIPGAQLS
jgi:hypothetical protein